MEHLIIQSTLMQMDLKIILSILKGEIIMQYRNLIQFDPVETIVQLKDLQIPERPLN